MKPTALIVRSPALLAAVALALPVRMAYAQTIERVRMSKGCKLGDLQK